MPFIAAVQKRNQRLFIGEAKDIAVGLGPNGVVISPNGDSGSVTSGVQGDTVLETMAMNAFAMAAEVLQQSPTIATFMASEAAGTPFACAYSLGDYEVTGFGVVQNIGEVSGAQGTNVRTITIAFAKQAGGLTGTGEILATG